MTEKYQIVRSGFLSTTLQWLGYRAYNKKHFAHRARVGAHDK